MEGMKDVALAHYENLPDEEKLQIGNDFKQTVRDGRVPRYFKFHIKFNPEVVDECLNTCERYKKEASLDFNDFITLNYILQNQILGKCKGCSSLILGNPYFSCYECFLTSSVGNYDLCCGCYRSKKFKDHEHLKFYDDRTLLHLRKRMLGKEINELKEQPGKENDAVIRIKKRMIGMSLELMEIARSIEADGWGDNLDTVFKYKRGIDAKEEANSTKLQGVRPRINITDVLGMSPSLGNGSQP